MTIEPPARSIFFLQSAKLYLAVKQVISISVSVALSSGFSYGSNENLFQIQIQQDPKPLRENNFVDLVYICTNTLLSPVTIVIRKVGPLPLRFQIRVHGGLHLHTVYIYNIASKALLIHLPVKEEKEKSVNN